MHTYPSTRLSLAGAHRRLIFVAALPLLLMATDPRMAALVHHALQLAGNPHSQVQEEGAGK